MIIFFSKRDFCGWQIIIYLFFCTFMPLQNIMDISMQCKEPEGQRARPIPRNRKCCCSLLFVPHCGDCWVCRTLGGVCQILREVLSLPLVWPLDNNKSLIYQSYGIEMFQLHKWNSFSQAWLVIFESVFVFPDQIFLNLITCEPWELYWIWFPCKCCCSSAGQCSHNSHWLTAINSLPRQFDIFCQISCAGK